MFNVITCKLSHIRFDGKLLYNLEANQKTLFSHKLIRDLEILITIPSLLVLEKENTVKPLYLER
jgi:hypothetical protein